MQLEAKALHVFLHGRASITPQAFTIQLLVRRHHMEVQSRPEAMLEVCETDMMAGRALSKGAKGKKDLVRDIQKISALDVLANGRQRGTGSQQVIGEVSTDTLHLQATPVTHNEPTTEAHTANRNKTKGHLNVGAPLQKMRALPASEP